MEPLSALGLAAGVIQFVQFAGTLVSLGHSIQRSADGSHEWGRELEGIYGRLSEFGARLEADRHQKHQQHAGGAPQPAAADVNVRALTDLAAQCQDLCRQLLDTVARLRVQPGSSYRTLRTFRAVLRTVWSTKIIADLETRLGRVQNVLSMHFYPVLR